MNQNKTTKSDQNELKKSEVEVLREELQQAQNREKRAIADYQNLVRRQREERIIFVRYAAKEFIESILEPLDHLSLASQQITNKGLSMIISSFWQKLNEAGLEEFDPVGQEFDENIMEAVESERVQQASDKKSKDKVTKVISKGYKLNGEIIRHAKVVVGN